MPAASRMREIQPFSEIELRVFLKYKDEALAGKVDSYSNDEILANDLELLADNLFEEYRICPFEIGPEDETKRKLTQVKINKKLYRLDAEIYGHDSVQIDGVHAEACYPFDGDMMLIKNRPSTFSSSGYPYVTIRGNYLMFTAEASISEVKEGGAEKLLATIENDCEKIRRGIEYANDDANKYNETLRQRALDLLHKRKDKVDIFASVAKDMRIPLERSSFGNSIIEVKRKIKPIQSTYKKEATYSISDSDYRDILDTIFHFAATLEQNPTTYKGMGEEGLRNVLLANLNTTYLGNAAGERFRNNGKTDICIETENRAAFVAECKIWGGQKTIVDALMQLESYLTWRDCKASLIVFSRRKGFAGVLDKTVGALTALPTAGSFQHVTDGRYVIKLASEENVGRYITVTVLVFNLFSE